MNLKRKRRLDADVYTGAMADVSFLLIIFFMITSAFAVTKGMDLTLDHSEGPVEAWEAIDVHVRGDGVLMVDGRALELAGLLPYISAKLDQNRDKPVLLRGDPTTTYGAMIQVLDELRMSNEKLGFAIENVAMPTFREQQVFMPFFDS